jgi:hypothetical protein
MRDTITNASLTISQKRESSDRDDTYSPAKRRVVTTARREQNRVAQKAYRESIVVNSMSLIADIML